MGHSMRLMINAGYDSRFLSNTAPGKLKRSVLVAELGGIDPVTIARERCI